MAGIIDLIVNVFLIFFILRLALEPRQFYFNPMLQPIEKATDVFLKPLRTVFRPTSKGFDYTPLIAILLFVVIRAVLMQILVTPFLGFTVNLVYSARRFIDFVFQAYVVMLIISAFIFRHTLNPLGRFIFQILNPIMKPAEKLAGGAGNLLIIPVIIILTAAHMLAVFGLQHALGIQATLPMTIHNSLVTLISVLRFFYIVVIIGALMSWFSPDPGNPLVQMIHLIVEPLLRPVRRVLPTLGGIDFSPIVVIFALVYLQRILMATVDQLFGMGGWRL